MPWVTSAASALGILIVGVLVFAVIRGRRRGRRLLLVATAIPVLAATWLLVANGLAVPFA